MASGTDDSAVSPAAAPSPFKAIIVGAGPVGLGMANCLRLAKIDFVVLEARSDLLAPNGAGLVLMPQGTRLLHQFGVLDEAIKSTGAMMNMAHIGPDGTMMLTNPMFKHMSDSLGYPVLGWMRADIMRILFQALGDEGAGKIRENARVVAISQTDSGVAVTLEDGSTVRGSILIGADGVHSAVRRILTDQDAAAAEAAAVFAAAPETVAVAAAAKAVAEATAQAAAIAAQFDRAVPTLASSSSGPGGPEDVLPTTGKEAKIGNGGPLHGETVFTTHAFKLLYGRSEVPKALVGTCHINNIIHCHGDGYFLQIIVHEKMYFWALYEWQGGERSNEHTTFTQADEEAFASKYFAIPIVDNLTFRGLWDTKEWSTLDWMDEGIAKHWYGERIVMVGDATAKLNPSQALGANSGLESTACLANHLHALLRQDACPSTAALEAAFAKYQAERGGLMEMRHRQSAFYAMAESWATGPARIFWSVFNKAANSLIMRLWANPLTSASSCCLDFIDFPEQRSGTFPWLTKKTRGRFWGFFVGAPSEEETTDM